MNLKESLVIERYKFVTDRQKYFTDLARVTFNSYIKIFITLLGGTIALISVKSSLSINSQVFTEFIIILSFLVTAAGLASIFQIRFCLWRWYGFRRAEISIDSGSPPIKKGAWIFEGLYILIILISIVTAWTGLPQLILLITEV